jgi:hypothetical protein
VEAHFHNEGINEVEKACEFYTDDIVWEAPARNLRFVNKQDVIDNYHKMFASAKNVEFRNYSALQRVNEWSTTASSDSNSLGLILFRSP